MTNTKDIRDFHWKSTEDSRVLTPFDKTRVF